MIRRLPEGNEYDVTPYLDNDADIELTQEDERDAFERVVGDIHIKASNQSGIFHRTIFGNSTPVNKWETKVIDESTRKLFLGRVDPTAVIIDAKTEWMELDAFAATGLFWEECDQATMGKFASMWTANDYIRLADLLASLFYVVGLTYRGINIGIFADRRIRCASDNSTIGNIGRLKEINPDMTVKQFLEVCAIYYNAEFYVDPESELVTMIPRNVLSGPVIKSIDDVLEDDTEMAVEWADSQKADYIYTFMANAPLRPPLFGQAFGGGGMKRGTYGVLMTGVFDGAEALLSWPATYFDLGDPPEHTDWQVTYGVQTTEYPTIQQRNIYRYNYNDAQLGWRRVGYVLGNSYAVFTDGFEPNEFAQFPQLSPGISNIISAWLGYNETSGLWLDPIFDIGTNKPAGKIVDVRPQIQFTEIGDPSTLRPYSALEVLSLFAMDNTLPNIHQQFLEMLLLKRRLKVIVKGTNYRVGDGYSSQLLSSQGGLGLLTNYLVKKAVVKILKEKTQLEMVPV